LTCYSAKLDLTALIIRSIAPKSTHQKTYELQQLSHTQIITSK